MLRHNLLLIKQSLSFAVGADIEISQKKVKGRDFIEIWFSQLDKVGGPIIELSPTGTRRHNVKLRFGSFSQTVIDIIKETDFERMQLARLLISQIDKQFGVTFSTEVDQDNWLIEDGKFGFEVERKGIVDYFSDREITETCNKIIVPVLGALAELIGYEELPDTQPIEYSPKEEGGEYFSTVLRRERNPRNRLLCLEIHGDRCSLCGFTSNNHYPSLGSIIEVHHIEQLSEIQRPRIYNPVTDLIPLCPNCHRAIHKKRPPFTPSELRELYNEN
jgi:5-methylcytosine-specific restriction protein A